MRYMQLKKQYEKHFEYIKCCIEKERKEGYGQIYPNCEEPLENVPNPVDNSIVFNLFTEDDMSERILASEIYNEIKEKINPDDFIWELCPGPVVRICFEKSSCGIKRDLVEKILSKERYNGCSEMINGDEFEDIFGFVFQIKSQPHVFDKILDEILDDLRELNPNFKICYYRHL